MSKKHNSANYYFNKKVFYNIRKEKSREKLFQHEFDKRQSLLVKASEMSR